MTINKIKLLILATILFVLIPAVFSIVAGYYHVYTYFIVLSIPIISILFCLVAGGTFNYFNDRKKLFKSIKNTITSIKYYKAFPILFYYDPFARYHRFKDDQFTQEKKPALNPGDIILRRHDNYIDGLILKQSSYFTHAAIYCGEDTANQNNTIIQAIGENGVSWVDIVTFCNCDDITVLRLKENLFDVSPLKDMNWLVPGDSDLLDVRGDVYSDEKIELNDKEVMDLINENKDHNLRKREMDVFKILSVCKNKKIPYGDKVKYSNVIPIILDVTKGKLGAEYDFLFSFVDPKRVSCVELAWSSYKCLFPVHEILDEKHNFFSIVKTQIIVPDSFIKSRAFDLIYCSIENINTDKDRLIDFVTSNKFNIWTFVLKYLLLQILLSGLIWATWYFIFNSHK